MIRFNRLLPTLFRSAEAPPGIGSDLCTHNLEGVTLQRI